MVRPGDETGGQAPTRRPRLAVRAALAHLDAALANGHEAVVVTAPEERFDFA